MRAELDADTSSNAPPPNDAGEPRRGAESSSPRFSVGSDDGLHQRVVAQALVVDRVALLRILAQLLEVERTLDRDACLDGRFDDQVDERRFGDPELGLIFVARDRVFAVRVGFAHVEKQELLALRVGVEGDARGSGRSSGQSASRGRAAGSSSRSPVASRRRKAPPSGRACARQAGSRAVRSQASASELSSSREWRAARRRSRRTSRGSRWVSGA